MIQKIFTKLKQAYSPLGLGDAILMGHAEALAGLGFVTDDNIDAVVTAQKGFLEQLQKSSDSRVQNAIAKARETEKLEAEKAAKAAADAAAKALEEAKTEARNAALKEAEEKAKEAAAKAKADLEAAVKAAEAAAKAAADDAATKVPEWYTRERDESARVLEEIRSQARQQAEDIRKQMAESSRLQAEEFAKRMEEARAAADLQSQRIDALTRENEEMKAAANRAERLSFITSKAKDMGIPQYRIDEGFAGIGENSTDDEIVGALATIARNIKANQIPDNAGHYVLGDGNPTKADVENLAKVLVK